MKNTLIVLFVSLVLMGCTAAQREAAFSGAVVAASTEPVVEATKQWIKDDEIVVSNVKPSFDYLDGRYKVYEGMDPATQIVPLILQRSELWAKAKSEAYTIRDGLLEYEERSGRPMPALISAYITETEAFISAVDKAISENDTNMKAQYITANLGRILLISQGLAI